MESMLPQIPTLLLNPDPKTLDVLLELVHNIKCPKEDVFIRNYFLENYVHCNKAKIDKKREKSTEPQNLCQKPKKKLENECLTCPQQLFLKEAIQKNQSWSDIAKKLNLEQKDVSIKRTEWNFSIYLIFSVLQKLKGTLGHFISIRLMNRSWSTSESAFRALQNSAFFEKKFKELIDRDPKQIEKIQFAFLKDLILSIKLNENIEDCLKRINYANWMSLKREGSSNVAYLAQDWVGFLCKKIQKTREQERPIIKFERQQFILKWAKVRNIALAINNNFQQQLARLLKQKEHFGKILINDIEIILIEGHIANKKWSDIKKEIQGFVYMANEIQKVRLMKQIDQQHSQHTPRTYKTRKNAKNQRSAQSQLKSFSSNKLTNSSHNPMDDFDQTQLKSQPIHHNSFNSELKSRKASNAQKMKQIVVPSKREPSQLKLSTDEKIILEGIDLLIQKLNKLKRQTFPGVQVQKLDRFREQNREEMHNLYSAIFKGIKGTPDKLWLLQNNLRTVFSMILSNDRDFMTKIIKKKREGLGLSTYSQIQNLRQTFATKHKSICIELDQGGRENTPQNGNRK